ncbi:uncharacterized protein Z518_05566 [Rhinocladiella mackenziei CBS 650.93]|uniref:Rhinocladiella mackenziei CBS 650.93 unplaced genomic scaffold supercont1.4, whole genome shotgun sequence n=1 Tax=Rhinocladiella mackenziei CBS 650.93 TaxID=1442369 RepID=A0A0D2INI2_9EURO|nr:uncharacterized protein Z518_05566 [Rhinocladiella mackenziei CBS 650.93]KIX04696.1 hypothetical protein Z518_05566 [Rhinocladiella mackenziei CBS 650.93]
MGLTCSYEAALIWVKQDGSHDISSERRYRSCEETWKNIPILDSDTVDGLISQCDPEHATESISDFKVVFHVPDYNPFTAFRSSEQRSRHALLSASRIPNLEHDPLSPTPLTQEERMLFHHYVNHVAIIMMPFEHPRNPWKSSYPARALHHTLPTQRSLFNALLAHAAFNLAHLTSSNNENMARASKYYGLSIKQLLDSLNRNTEPDTDTLAVVMTLMMAELYSGQSRNWRHHFRGAWDVFWKYQAQRPWEDSDFACASIQSLNIIGIISDTSRLAYDAEDGQDKLHRQLSDSDAFDRNSSQTFSQESFSVIKSTHEFGFTIGATQEILECISCISDMNRDSDSSEVMEDRCQGLLSLLNVCRSNLANQASSGSAILNPAAHYQLGAFVNATFIYFYRTLFDLPPGKLENYVIETLENVNLFMSHGYGNMSLWPAFIAAVEASSDGVMSMARTWLEAAITVGMGSRFTVKKVVDEVWRKREVASRKLNLDRQLIAVDWREVMKELNVDVLLV